SQKFLPSIMMDTIKPSLAGWHDAGDYGKYVTNGAFTVGMMLQAFERFQPTLSALELPIPEKGGALPDFLDEVKWELDWLLTTQGEDGSVSFKVTAHLHGHQHGGDRRLRGGVRPGRAHLPAVRQRAGRQLPGRGPAFVWLPE